MMNKYIRILIISLASLLLLALILTLIFIFFPPKYQLINWFGTYYIRLEEKYNFSSRFDFGYFRAPLVYFESISEMKHDITTGNFTEDELYEIGRVPRSNKRLVEIFDLSNIYEPIYPSSFDSFTVAWEGTYYSFQLSEMSGDKRFAAIGLTSESYYNKQLERMLGYGDNVNCYDTGYESDRNASVYYFSSGSKHVVYQITNQDTTLTINEVYDYNGGYDNWKLEFISILGYTQGQYFSAEINCRRTRNRPSVEYLSQFGIKKYEG